MDLRQPGGLAVGCFRNVEDLIIDDETWTIRFLIIETRTWWPGKKVLIASQWITHIDWGDSKVLIDFPHETPCFDEGRHHHHMPQSHQHEFNPSQR